MSRSIGHSGSHTEVIINDDELIVGVLGKTNLGKDGQLDVVLLRQVTVSVRIITKAGTGWRGEATVQETVGDGDGSAFCKVFCMQ